MDTIFHLNDRVILEEDFCSNYEAGDICTVKALSHGMVGILSDTDSDDSCYLYVKPEAIVHTPRQPERPHVDPITHVTNVPAAPPCSYGGGSTGTTGHSIDHFPHIKAAPAAPVQAEKADVVVRPAHYTRWVIEPITFIMRNGMEFWRGNIIKYIARAGEKQYDGLDKVQSEITDLRKAARYCEIRINQLQGKGDSEL